MGAYFCIDLKKGIKNGNEMKPLDEKGNLNTTNCV